MLMDASVMFVDDESEILDILQKFFEQRISRVYVADRPSVALEIQAINQLDLVVLDLDMPEMNGLELLGRLRANTPDLRSVFISGRGQKESVQAALRLETCDFIDKPFRLDAVGEIIERALNKVRQERKGLIARDILQLQNEKKRLGDTRFN